MFYELRRYTVYKGKMKQWVKLMEEEIIPFQTSMGMVISGSFTVEKSETLYLWLRRFASERGVARVYLTGDLPGILAASLRKTT